MMRRQARFGIDLDDLVRPAGAAAAAAAPARAHTWRNAAEADVRRVASKQRRQRRTGQRHRAGGCSRPSV